MSSIDSRLAALAEAIERKRMEEEAPVDELSRSLYNMGQRLSKMDSLEKAALLAEFNRDDPLDGTGSLDLSMEDIERFILDYKGGVNICLCLPGWNDWRIWWQIPGRGLLPSNIKTGTQS